VNFTLTWNFGNMMPKAKQDREGNQRDDEERGGNFGNGMEE
jgi:hypothetical protein